MRGPLLIAAYLAISTPAFAANYDKSDFQSFHELQERGYSLQRDLSVAEQGALERLLLGQDDGSADCLSDLRNVAVTITDELDEETTLIGLKDLMITSEDRTTIIRIIDIDNNRLPDFIALNRSEIDRVSSRCGTNYFVQAKAAGLLAFFDQIIAGAIETRNKTPDVK